MHPPKKKTIPIGQNNEGKLLSPEYSKAGRKGKQKCQSYPNLWRHDSSKMRKRINIQRKAVVFARKGI